MHTDARTHTHTSTVQSHGNFLSNQFLKLQFVINGLLEEWINFYKGSIGSYVYCCSATLPAITSALHKVFGREVWVWGKEPPQLEGRLRDSKYPNQPVCLILVVEDLQLLIVIHECREGH